MTLAANCYQLTKAFPREEMFGLTSQIHRAGSSIPANIAEGYGRENTGTYIQFLRIAQGSLKELETHILLSQKVEIVTPHTCEPILKGCDSLGRMLHKLIRSVQETRT